MVKQALKVLIDLNRFAHTAHKGLESNLSKEYKAVLKLFLSPDVYGALFDTSVRDGPNGLKAEEKELSGILTALPNSLNAGNLSPTLDKIQEFHDLIGRWIAGDKHPAAIAAFSPIASVFDTITKGRIGELIDFGQLEHQVRETLLQFIPNEVYTDLGWATTIDPFPSESGKFFWIERKLRDPKLNLGALTTDYLKRRKKDKLQPANPDLVIACLLYTSPSPRDQRGSRMPSSA